MTEEKKSREFWIFRDDDLVNHDCVLRQEPFGTHSSKFIHVIEYSAYKRLQKELDELKRAMAIETNSFEERSQEAAHYNWLDDQLEMLRKDNERLRQENHDEAVRYWDTMNGRGAAISMLRKCVGVLDTAILNQSAMKQEVFSVRNQLRSIGQYGDALMMCDLKEAEAFASQLQQVLTEAKEFLEGVEAARESTQDAEFLEELLDAETVRIAKIIDESVGEVILKIDTNTGIKDQ